MPALTRAQLAAALTARLPDNTAAAITPADLRAILSDLADSVRWGSDAAGPAGAPGWQVRDVRDLTPPTHAYTLGLADEATLLRFTGGAQLFAVQVPADATAAFRVGAVIHIEQASVHRVEIVAAPGVTVRTYYRALPMTNGEGRIISLLKVATNLWRVFGEAEPSPIGMVVHDVLTIDAASTFADATTQRKRIVFTRADPVEFRLHPDATFFLPAGADFELVQAGTGSVTVVPGAGVTVRRRAGAGLSLAGQHCRATVVKLSSDEWLLTGELGLS